MKSTPSSPEENESAMPPVGAFKALAAAVADTVFILRTDGEVAYAGPGLQNVIGRAPHELERRPFLDFVHPDDAVRDENQPFWKAPLPFEREFRMRTARGKWVWVRAVSETTDHNGERTETTARVLGDHTFLLVRDISPTDTINNAEDIVRSAFDSVNNLVVVADVRLPDAPLTVVNQNFLDTTGYRRSEIIGKNCRFLQVRGDGTRDDEGDGQKEALDAIRTAVKRGASTNVLLRNYKKDGTLFYNRLFLSPVRNASGEVTHFVGVQNDVTEEMTQAKAADTQRQLLQAFFESAPFLMGVVEFRDGEVRHQTANEPALSLFRAAGAEFDDIEGLTLEEVGFNETEREVWYRHLQECASTAQPVQFDTVHPWGSKSGSGNARDFSVSVNPVGGDSPLFAYVVDDVTDRRRGEAERRLLSAAMEQAAEAIVVTGPAVDPPGPKILYANRAHTRTFGHEVEAIVGKTPRIYQGPKTDRTVLDRVRRKMESGEPVRAETVNYRKDGSEFILEWEIAPVRDEEGHVTNWVGTQRDVTERRQLEHDLLQAQAMEQEKMARELHDGLGQVLVGTRLMLSALHTSLASGAEDPAAANLTSADLAALAETAQRAETYVAEAYDQARAISHGLFPVGIEADGLPGAIGKLCKPHGNVSCEGSLDERSLSSPEAAGHLLRIAQEAVNNAFRHADAGRIHIALAREGDEGVLAVTDDGTGISDDAMERGGGLGMRTMAYRARRVGGELDVRPENGGGTVVAVRFPLASEE